MSPAAQHHLDTLLERSARLARQAEDIMATLRVRELWGRLGRVVLVGSARYGLLNTPNIDFEIYVEQPDAATGAAIMTEIAAAPGVTGLVHHDFLDTSDPGLYWRLDYLAQDGERWDFDIWLVPFSHPFAGWPKPLPSHGAGADAKNARDGPAPQAELAARAANSGTSDRAASTLQGRVARLRPQCRGLRRLLRLNPPPEMETWRPGCTG